MNQRAQELHLGRTVVASPDAYCVAVYTFEPVADESLDLIVAAILEHLPLPGHPDRTAIIFGQAGDVLRVLELDEDGRDE